MGSVGGGVICLRRRVVGFSVMAQQWWLMVWGSDG